MQTEDLQLTAIDLRPMAVISQGIDNQYVPFDILKGILGKKSRKEIQPQLSHHIRAEYLRSLLYSDQIIINRAYLINTPEINQDFLPSSPYRDTFLELVKKKYILPWLFTEKTLDESPKFDLNFQGWEAFHSLAKEENIFKVKLSWNEEENINKTNSLSKTFTSYIMGMRIVSDQIADDFGIIDKKGFSNRLSDVTKFCLEIFDKTGRPVVTRSQLYEKFVCIDKTPITEGYYDVTKPFCLYLKVLFDLKYSVNLPDAFQIQAFTGRGLPSRSILHELDWNPTDQKKAVTLDVPELLGSLVINDIQQAFWLDSVERLNLKQILKIRETTKEWEELIDASSNLDEQSTKAVRTGKVSEPLDFNRFQNAFINFQTMLGKMFPNEQRKEVKPEIEIQTKIGNITFNISPSKKTYSIIGNIKTLTEKESPFSTSIILDSSSNNDLGYSFDFMSTKINDARNQAEKFVEKIKKGGFIQTNNLENLSNSNEGALVDDADFFGMPVRN